MDPYTGQSPVNPDGSFRTVSGGIDWLEGYGPQYNWNGMDQPTGQAPTRAAPPPGTSPKGTPGYRQAIAAHEQWIEENLRAGRTLADLGLEPTRARGLSSYMKYGSFQRGGGGAPATAPAQPAAPGPGTGGYLPGTGGDYGWGGAPAYGGPGAQTLGGPANSLQNAIMALLMGRG